MRAATLLAAAIALGVPAFGMAGDPPEVVVGEVDPSEVPEEACPQGDQVYGEPFYYHGGWLQPLEPLPRYGSERAGPIAVRSYADANGRVYRAEEDMLPSAADPNDIEANPLFTRQSLGMGVAPLPFLFATPPEYAASEMDPKVRFGLQARPGIFYDTGFVGNTFFPPSIALDGSAGAHKRGQLSFVGLPDQPVAVPLRGQFDLQTLEFLNFGPIQGYVDVVAPNESQAQLRTAMFRVLDGTVTEGLMIGKAETAFGDLASAPMLIDTGALPIGAISVTQNVGGSMVFSGIPQLRLTRYWRNRTIESTGTIEDQSALKDVLQSVSSTTILNRWPVFAGRLRFKLSDFNSVQFAALARPIVFDNIDFADHSATGWGVSTIARFCNAAKTDAVYLGAALGQGIGGYIYGGTYGAVIASQTEVTLLRNFGTYAGWQKVWYERDKTHNLSSNLAYGYVIGDAADPEQNRELHQAWCNLLWNATDKTAYGLEYQFGSRRIGNGTEGDDHRIMFVFQAQINSKAPGAQQTRAYETRSESDSLSGLRL